MSVELLTVGRVGVDLYEQGVKQLDDRHSVSSVIVGKYLTRHPTFRFGQLPLADQHFVWKYFDDIPNTSEPWRRRIHEQRFRVMLAARTEEIARLIGPDQERFDRQRAPLQRKWRRRGDRCQSSR